MAFGQFTDYAPAEVPGAFNFRTTDGKELLFSGPEADELKARIDASNSMNTVAGPGGGGNPFNKSAADLEGAGSKIAAQNQESLGTAPQEDKPPASIAAPAAGEDPQTQQQGGGLRPVVVNGVNTGYVQDASGQVYEHRAGTAGVSKEQLQRTATQGVATPSSAQETVAGGFEADQNFLEGRRDRTVDQRLLLDRERELALKETEAERQFQRDQFVAASNAQQEQQAQLNAIQTQVAKDEQLYRKARAEFSSSRVDPERYFKRADDAAPGLIRVVNMFAAGLGAFGAAMTGTRNFALDTIQAAIDNDIRAQEADIRVKGEAADNALIDLQRSGMSLDQAKISLKAIQTEYARSKFLEARAASANERVNAQFDQLDLKLQENLANADETYRQDSIGRATKTVAAAYQYPRSGSAGGFAPVTGQRGLELAGGLAEVEGKTAGTAKTIGEIGGGSGGGSKGQLRLNAEINNAGSRADEMLGRLSKYDDDEVPPIGENKNILSRVGNAATDFVAGAGTSNRNFRSERDRAMIQDVEGTKLNIMGMTSMLNGQGAMTDAERVAAERGLAPGATVGDVKRAVAILKAGVKAVQAGERKLNPPVDLSAQSEPKAGEQ